MKGNNMAIETATLGGGCFWCLEAVYQELKGVQHVESGYAGGQVVNPTYEQVCEGTTGHAEVVRLQFDPSVISYRDILEIFFTIHDPTTLNRQGNDIGTQYRPSSSSRRRAAGDCRHVIAEMANVWDAPIVTQLSRCPTVTRPRTITRITSARTRCRATAPISSRPRSRNSARPSRTG